MKKYIKYLLGLTVVTGLTTSSCKKEFFNKPPKDAITLDSYYQTNDQVLASTNILYSATWFGWCGKAGWSITDLSGGNGRTYSSDVVNFSNFSVTDANFELGGAWNSLFITVAQANALINNLPAKVPATVDKAVVNNALGEARLFRALAYFHLVRTWGPVPIIENSLDYVDNYQINANIVPDVYKFIVNDLKFAEENLTKMGPRSGKSTGRVSSGSASALLAKVYLYMQDYTNAKAQADKVINSGEFKLYGADVAGKTFNDLFLTANNNNEESIIQLQWSATGGYGKGNPQQASFAYNSLITGTGDGYGVLAPTFDLQDMYEAGDLRRKATIMLPGDHYPEINSDKGGYTLPADANSQGTHAQVKKYVVGTPADNGGVSAAQSAPNNTYMMRLADVYLIKAEAVMAGASTSSDPEALAAINKVRNRAGLGNLSVIKRFYTVANPNLSKYGATPSSAVPLTVLRDDIIDERRREFAFEDDFWFDIGRVDGFNVTTHPRGIQMIKQQDRGTSDNSTPPVRYANEFNANVTDASFRLPYPATEVASNPKLKEAPVPYVFK
ncbi:RagB/SusD family nutrient uptake outer membrane protein [Mucilaginibacter sp. ZT4R22]|uniref:RagB/SusD family nutrient uptake outer membrane protein n=1 Tax=Mucilaginibacter pankratovii TaxID=2772110 RepID=A0ABR7WL94_9SPHI|nr:RagB/SusD family nutrient uptake outer membrane protein [Mucilaginibacter pankratovii]MBD1363100.1 RagB/SusD family nutrient uptake outer membrane protein [Mucilaginibacter pankratovii]